MENKIFMSIQFNEEKDILEYFQKGEDVDIQNFAGSTLLHWASWFGNEKTLLLVLKYIEEMNKLDDIDRINKKDNAGNTPLHYACQIQNEQNIQILLKAGADRNEKNLENKTPFDCISRNMRYKIERDNC